MTSFSYVTGPARCVFVVHCIFCICAFRRRVYFHVYSYSIEGDGNGGEKEKLIFGLILNKMPT